MAVLSRPMKKIQTDFHPLTLAPATTLQRRSFKCFLLTFKTPALKSWRKSGADVGRLCREAPAQVEHSGGGIKSQLATTGFRETDEKLTGWTYTAEKQIQYISENLLFK